MVVAATIENTVGAAFLGCVAASILFGVTFLQVYLYYIHYTKDWMFQKVAVGVLTFLDALHLTLTVHALYHYLILNFGDYRAQTLVVWSFKLQIAVNILIIVIVHSLYALRIWKLGRHWSKLWPSLVAGSVVLASGVGILLAVETYNIKSFAELGNVAWAIYASFITSTVIDIIIAVAISYYMLQSQSAFEKTNSRLLTIMRYSLAAGFLTSACSLTAVIFFAVMPKTLVFLAIEFLLTKLYINSYMAMLNARSTIREGQTSTFSRGRVVGVDIHGPEGANSISLSTRPPGEYYNDFEGKLERKMVRSRSTNSNGALEISVHRTAETAYERGLP